MEARAPWLRGAGKLIYDAAHAFGTTHNGRPLASFGDASMLSFHATKLFHTAEGGALIVGDPVTKANVDLQRNFGIASETEVVLPGINAKMSELSAALGLSVLPHSRASADAGRASPPSTTANFRQCQALHRCGHRPPPPTACSTTSSASTPRLPAARATTSMQASSGSTCIREVFLASLQRFSPYR